MKLSEGEQSYQEELHLIVQEIKANLYKRITETQHGVENYPFWEPILSFDKKSIGESTPIEYKYMFNPDKDKRRRQRNYLLIKMQSLKNIDSQYDYLQDLCIRVRAEHEYRQDQYFQLNRRKDEYDASLFTEFKVWIDTVIKDLFPSLEDEKITLPKPKD